MWSRRPPDEVARRILRAVFGSEVGHAAGPCQANESPVGAGGLDRPGPRESSRPAARAYPLTRFQEAAFARVRRTLDRRGGAVLADAVGLGKTYVALAVAEERLRRGGDVVVLVPAALRPVWSRPLRRIARAGGRSSACRLLSHTQLSRGAAIPDADGSRLIVVDEAHRFRNPSTLRYRALARLAAGRYARDARTAPHPVRHGDELEADPTRVGPELLLVTATPVNNTLADLYHLVRLFLPDDALRRAGIPSVRAVFDTHPPDPAGLQILVRELVVRRSRPMVEQRYGPIRATHFRTGPTPVAVAPSDAAVRFPGRAPPRIHRYRDPGVRGRVGAIETLELAVYGSGAGPLIRLGLLKRMDSSPAAFLASLHRLGGYLEAVVEAAGAGRLLRPGHRTGPGDGDPLQLPLLGVVADPAPPDIDLEALVASAVADRRAVDALADDLSGSDAKADELIALLKSLAGDRVLVFTEYRDTAESLWRTLAGCVRVGRIDGSGAWLGAYPAGRRTVVQRFAPVANGRPRPPERERVDVLIATDVLAEGLNLQDARHVISYDLPWNPVRLLQRIGRVDRLGSSHDEVVPHLFVPDHGLDAVLGLTRRLRGKLHGISSVLDEPHADDLLRGLVTGRADRVEAALRTADGDDLDDPWERLRTAWLKARASEPGGPDAFGPDAADDEVHPADPASEVLRVWAGVRPAPGGTVGRPTPGDTARPPASEDGRLLALVLLVDPAPERRGAQEVRLLEVTADHTVRPLGSAGADLLARALNERPPGDPSSGPRADSTGPAQRLRPVLKALARHQSALAARCQAPTALSARSPAARLARRIRRLMADAGAGLSPAVVRDGERVLRALGDPLPLPVERALVRLLDESAPADDDPDSLLSAAVDLLRAREPGERESGGPMDPGITAVRAVLFAHPKPG